MKILLTNDDGYQAEGLIALHAALADRHELVVCAPARECSATGHGLTLRDPIRLHRHQENGHVFHGFDGLPADAAKFGLSHLCVDALPDLVLSGINHGANTGQNIFYSGTVGAASEGSFRGIPSMALSLAGIRPEDFNPGSFSEAAAVCADLVDRFESAPFPGNVLLNVNVPLRPREEILGIRPARMGYARFHEQFMERQDPKGQPYFWMDGAKDGDDKDPDTDDYLVHAGYVTLCALDLDMSHPDWSSLLDDWKLQGEKA